MENVHQSENDTGTDPSPPLYYGTQSVSPANHNQTYFPVLLLGQEGGGYMGIQPTHSKTLKL